jgi:RNA polymerase sigma-70 factor (ECF subfamily)
MRLDSDAELVLKARRGDAAAFERLIRIHESTALAVAYGITGESASAADATQEAFIRAWQRLRELQEPQRFGAWLGRIVRNLATDVVRRGPRKWFASSDAMSHDVPCTRMTPAEEVEQSDVSRRIEQALAELDELTRSAVVLRYYQNLSSKQIGELLEMSPAAVDMRLSRARSQLRRLLTDMNEANEPNVTEKRLSDSGHAIANV